MFSQTIPFLQLRETVKTENKSYTDEGVAN